MKNAKNNSTPYAILRRLMVAAIVFPPLVGIANMPDEHGKAKKPQATQDTIKVFNDKQKTIKGEVSTKRSLLNDRCLGIETPSL